MKRTLPWHSDGKDNRSLLSPIDEDPGEGEDYSISVVSIERRLYVAW